MGVLKDLIEIVKLKFMVKHHPIKMEVLSNLNITWTRFTTLSAIKFQFSWAKKNMDLAYLDVNQ